ncbi:hypothetical protein CW751_12285 [Brumimicrobium salinarum]|uniref:PNPLA domain-containing protein n=1 Tax=Brumimicrobium salinarum TaxID=2058658 RepID=A0A2I0R0D0_9FLAO|nr:patatin-like phospholipase family protein [Brumimicrobium salinarum]PKR79995.1 hypothetical protein CW751_12285 [Brumimicrobium salinarum]
MLNENVKIVVSIDGGGIRGVLPLLLLDHLNNLLMKQQICEDLSKEISLIAGTSTGAIISAGLIVKEEDKYLFSIQDLLNLYKLKGPQLFNLSNPGHEQSEGLKLVLKRKFKNIKLGQLDTHFAFVSYDKISRKPFIFDHTNPLVKTINLSTALSACSAVPGYFPSVRLDNYELIDGIMAAKNPSKIAYDIAHIQYPNTRIILLSFGTGKLKGDMYDDIEEKVTEVDIQLNSLVETDPYLKYYRFQPELNIADPQMDNATPDNINALIKDGENYIRQHSNLFEQLIKDLKK